MKREWYAIAGHERCTWDDETDTVENRLAEIEGYCRRRLDVGGTRPSESADPGGEHASVRLSGALCRHAETQRLFALRGVDAGEHTRRVLLSTSFPRGRGRPPGDLPAGFFLKREGFR